MKDFKWTSNSIKLLIELKFNFENEFTYPKCKKTKIWDKIAIQLRQKGYFVSGVDCSNKWKNLLVTYTRNVEKTKKTGEGKVTWEHFQQMQEVLCHKNAIEPPKEHLINTLTSNIDLSGNTEEESEDSTFENKENYNSIPKMKKRKLQSKDSMKSFLQETFELRLQYEKKRDEEEREHEERRWKEQVEIEQAKINAIRELAKALSSTKSE